MAYIGRQQDGFGVRSRFIYTATGGQTTFTTDNSSNALSYSDGAYVDVYLNGVLLDPSDYTATSLTSIVLDSGATASDILEVIVYDVFSVFSGTFTNGITASEATVTGELTVKDIVMSDADTPKITMTDTTNTLTTFIQSGNSSSIIGTSTSHPLRLQTNSTDAIYVDTSQNVGIGTSSPSSFFSDANQLVVGSGSGSQGITISSGTSENAQIFFADGTSGDAAYRGIVRYLHSSDAMAFYTSGANERMRIDSSGNVAIGTTSAGHPLRVSGGGFGTIAKFSSDDGSNNPRLLIYGSSSGMHIQRTSGSGASNLMFEVGGSEGGGTEAMRIDSSGNLLVGTTSVPSSSSGGAGFDPNTNGRAVLKLATTSTGNQGLAEFYNPNGQVGGIVVNGSATAFNTSSDYRLKENVTNITDGITRLKQLNPSRFNFIADDSTTVDGFLAHEAATVVPEAVTGTHNETEAIGDITDGDSNVVKAGVVEPNTLEDGFTWTETGTRPVYQGIDQSKLVPLLTAALQEAITKIETLEAKVTALENA